MQCGADIDRGEGLSEEVTPKVRPHDEKKRALRRGARRPREQAREVDLCWERPGCSGSSSEPCGRGEVGRAWIVPAHFDQDKMLDFHSQVRWEAIERLKGRHSPTGKRISENHA